MRPVRDFVTGFGYIFKGISYFFNNLRLWRYIAIPFSINIVLLIGLIIVLYFYLGDLTELFRQKMGLEFGQYLDLAWYAKIGIFFKNAFVHVLKFLLGFIVVIITGIAFFVVSQIIAAPFYDALCEKIEELYTKGKIAEISIWQSIKDIPSVILVEAQKLLILVAVPLMLLVLNLIPGIGSVIYVITAGAFTSAAYGAGFVDFIQAVKMQSFHARFMFARKHFFTLMGFGIPVLIPFINLFITPLMVTGGTLLYLDKSKSRSQS